MKSYINAETRQVVCVWHPEAQEGVFSLGNGVNARLMAGEPAYQVSDGNIIKDF